MKVLLTACSRCKKSFDFEFYNGLCPNCGCFHRAPGQTLNGTPFNEPPKTVAKAEWGTTEAKYETHMKLDKLRGVDHYEHKDTKPDIHERQTATRNRAYSTRNVDSSANRSSAMPFIKLVRVIVVFVCLISLFSSLASAGVLGDFLDSVVGEFSITRSVKPFEVKEYGDTIFEVYTAYSLSNSKALKANYGIDVPENKQLVAVSLDMCYNGEQPYYGDKAMPVVFDKNNGENVLAEALDSDIYIQVANDYEIGAVLLDKDTVYSSGRYEYGYLFYLVDQDADSIRFQVPCIIDGKVARKYTVELDLMYLN